ncbi:MAG: GHKL domain-containing protein [Clostridiales bacterium]|nr:GHKL domain-containing protein [Clostridiales bacterium]
MQPNLYGLVYILTNVFSTYTIYLFMKVFFETRRTKVNIEFLSYVLYSLAITFIYLFINIPIVLLFSNLIAFILLTFNYESTVKKRILSALLIYLVLLCVEMIVALFTGYFEFPVFAENYYSSIYGLILCRILSYVVVLLLNNFKNIRKGESVPNLNWLCIIFIPASSLYIILLLFQAKGLTIGQVIASIVLLLLINFGTFYLYDVITAAMADRIQSMMILEQNKYYDRQLEIMKSSLKATSTIRHDIRNHIFSIRSLIQSGETEETLDYIANIADGLENCKHYARSGNTIIDSILNFKCQEAEQLGIEIRNDLSIPEKLDIPSFDLTIILGNLLDNAIYAASKIEKDPYIDVKAKYDKGRLLIQVHNPFDGEIIEEKGKLLTTKKDKKRHGIGLINIENVLKKYDGTMDINYEDNIFSVTILMYID